MKPRTVLTLSLFLPGLLLVLLGAYSLAEMIQPLVMWKTSVGRVISLIDGGTGEETYFIQYEFEDNAGNKYEAVTSNAVGAEDFEVNTEITIYYKPQDPANSIPALLLASNFMVSLFIPFGLLLIWLGSPFDQKQGA